MRTTSRLDHLVRIIGAVALALGLALWTGRLDSLTTVHMALGSAVVLGLWGLSTVALVRGVSRALAFAGIALGLATVALGLFQSSLLVGNMHWVVQVLHLALGIASIVLAAALSRSLGRDHAEDG